MFIYHNSIRKYTLAMLETFNGLKVEYTKAGEIKQRNVPIKYANREKINLLNETEQNNLLSGNYNFLPRSSLSLVGIIRNLERQTNKFVKIATTDFGEFIFNATSFDFNFELNIMCRGMNEASMIVEQIASRFNPNYTLLINEIPNQAKPTSVPVQLLEIGIEPEEYEEMSTNICIVSASFYIKGNFYQPVEIKEKIKHFDIFLNMWYHSVENDYNRAKKYEFDVEDGIPSLSSTIDLVDSEGQFGNIEPQILDIIGPDTISTDTEVEFVCQWNDADNKVEELYFDWGIHGTATLDEVDDKVKVIATSQEIIELSCIITDVHNNTSNLFTKQITVV